MSNFFDNFMGGFAFGMLASNPFFGGGFYANRVDFGVFANPFPSIFPAGYYSTPSVQLPPSTFANPSYPIIDFTEVGQTIWDMTMDPNSPYNKQMREYYNRLNNNNSNPDKPNNNLDSVEISSVRQPEQRVSTSTRAVSVDEPDDVDADRKEKSKKISYDSKQLKDKWSKKQPQLTDKFYSRVVEISQKVKCSPDDLMALMNLETSRTFSPSVKCPTSTATGLIQFTEGSAKTLGTSIPQLKKMSDVKQLDYVEKYLVYWKKKVGFGNDEQLSAGDLYALVAQPANAKNEVLIVAGTDDYEKNKKSWDRNNDKKITKSELGQCLNDYRA